MPIEVAQMERQFAFGRPNYPRSQSGAHAGSRPRVLDLPVSGDVDGHHRWTGDNRPLSPLHHSAINRKQRLSQCAPG